MASGPIQHGTPLTLSHDFDIQQFKPPHNCQWRVRVRTGKVVIAFLRYRNRIEQWAVGFREGRQRPVIKMGVNWRGK